MTNILQIEPECKTAIPQNLVDSSSNQHIFLGLLALSVAGLENFQSKSPILVPCYKNLKLIKNPLANEKNYHLKKKFPKTFRTISRLKFKCKSDAMGGAYRFIPGQQ